MNLAPIILFVYNRPRHTLRTLEALMVNILADQSILYIYCDGLKDNATIEDKNKVEEVRRIIRIKRWCKEVKIIERKKNLGLANNIVNGISTIIDKYEKIIVLEDDIVTTTFFLEYMNSSLTHFQEDENVISVHGYAFPVLEMPKYYFLRGADCWGWATWKRGWDLFEENGLKLLKEIERRNLSYEFNFYDSFNYLGMLKGLISGDNQSWAIRWYASAFLKNKLTLYPGESYVQNIGNSGEGTHCKNTDVYYHEKLASSLKSFKDIPIEENCFAKQKIANWYLKETSMKSDNKINNFIAHFSNLKYKVLSYISRIREIVPFSKNSNYLIFWEGNYNSWDEAQVKCKGYNDEIILKKVLNATLKVKNGEAKYERDSVVFKEIQYSWGLLATLLKVATRNENKLFVVDFGGSLGSTYFQNRQYLEYLKELNWAIVEQPNFVDIGNKKIANKQLKFFRSVNEVIKTNKCYSQVLILSGVLQYLEEPYKWIENFLKHKFQYIIIDRTAFLESEKNRLTIQNVPESIYSSSYPAWFFNKNQLVKTFKGYHLVAEFDNGFTPPSMLKDKTKIYWKGMILCKN